MNGYLKEAKRLSNKVNDILGVMGNESVDLDSAGEDFNEKNLFNKKLKKNYFL